MTKQRTVAVVQARMGSSRLPGKVMADLGGMPLIEYLLLRLQRATSLDDIVVATSVQLENDELANHVNALGIRVFRGSEADVLARVADAARDADADVVVRITADCPFVDPQLVDAVVALRKDEAADWAGNVIERYWPDGLDVEAFTRKALDEANTTARDEYSRMHVTPYLHGHGPAGIANGNFKRAHLAAGADFSQLRWTVDEPEDLAFARKVAERLPKNFGWLELVALLTRESSLLKINGNIGLNEGAVRDEKRATVRSFEKSNSFFERAQKTIPLASQTFSKSFMTWTKGASPLFVERGRDAEVWDLDGNAYIDYVLGLLPIVLGYCDPDVDEAITQQLARGITFSLPGVLETEVAERIVKHVPSAEMVRFGKNGSDATTAAIRLARAFTGRDMVLVAGYHGWHDWYIGTTTRELGVPECIRALSGKFLYNDANSLMDALRRNPGRIAAVILEPSSTMAPVSGFLERVRELCTKDGVVLVFDEIITGFRMHMGGAQAHYGVTPDLTCLGKAIANGMPLSAVAGRRDIMRLMEDVFISGTMGGELLSLAAAAATIDKLDRENVPARLGQLGTRLMSKFNELSRNHGLADIVTASGQGWWPVIQFGTKLPVAPELLTSLLRQEFVANEILLAATFNMCLAHDTPRMEFETSKCLDRAFAALRRHLDSPEPRKCLRGDLIQPTFRVR